MVETLAREFDVETARKELPACEIEFEGARTTSRRPRLLSAMPYSPTLQQSFSGSTYYLAKAGMRAQTIDGIFSLYSGERPWRGLQVRGALWKLERMVRFQKTQGFKFTAAYLDRVWERYTEHLAGSAVINNFQAFSKEFFKRRQQLEIGAYFYIDGTFREYFDAYAEYDAAQIDPATRREAMHIEAEGYAQADHIFAMSARTALSLKEQYGVNSSRISVVIPGANLPEEALDGIESAVFTRGEEFVLGFVGLYPQRKGLDVLIGTTQRLRKQGFKIRLRVIGNCPDEMRNADGIEYLGRISKSTDLDRFLEAISGVHLGCLLSRAEMAGVAAVEFLRLGIPVIGTDVGGLTDILKGGGSLMVPADVSIPQLSDRIATLLEDEQTYLDLKQQALNRRRWASWARAAREIDQFVS